MSGYPAPNGHNNNNGYNNLPLHGPSIPSLDDPLMSHNQQIQHQHQHQQQLGISVAPSYQYDPQSMGPPQGQQSPQMPPPMQQFNDGMTNGHDGLPVPTGTPTSMNGTGEAPKGNRLRKACDSCSIRKVKCDESGPPCRACAALDIPCTFERPSRRRGPPNRHAEAIKKRRLEGSQGGGVYSSPTSPNNVAATLASFSSHAVLSAESILPLATLDLLIDDFFTYIHPLAPFPHEPSFRMAYKNREDLTNPSFIALVASMVGILVASFPRRPRLHLKAQQREHLFQNSLSLVERCHKVAVEARGPGYLDKNLSVYDAATSYFLGLSGAYTFKWRQCRLYFGETLNIIRMLGAHRTKNPGLTAAMGRLPATFGEENPHYDQPESVDYIRQEMGRRLFWVMFVGIRSMQQLGATFGELLVPPPTPNEPYPPLPLEVDDEFIFLDHIQPQPEGVLSNLAGFNMGVKIYMTCTPLTTMEMAYGIDQIFDYQRQKRVLLQCLSAVKHTFDQLPNELMLLPNSESGEFGRRDEAYYPPLETFPGARTNGIEGQAWNEVAADERRKRQYDIMKANIHASHLATRSYIVEKYWNLQDAHEQLKDKAGGSEEFKLVSPGLIASGLDGMLPQSAAEELAESNVMNERESIVKDLLKALSCLQQINMEPNGGSFVNKIRQIASTLVDSPQNRKGPFALRTEEYLGKFLDILMKLERASPGGARSESADGVVDEEEELNNWADLREYQTRFAQSGGFLNEL